MLKVVCLSACSQKSINAALRPLGIGPCSNDHLLRLLMKLPDYCQTDYLTGRLLGQVFSILPRYLQLLFLLADKIIYNSGLTQCSPDYLIGYMSLVISYQHWIMSMCKLTSNLNCEIGVEEWRYKEAKTGDFLMNYPHLFLSTVL